MKRIRLLGLALLAVLALGAIAAQGAMAEEPTILPATFPTTFEGASIKEPVLETSGKQTINCKKAKAKGEFTSGNAGTIILDFEGCKKEASACTGSGEATEVILTSGNFQLVDVLPTGTLDLGAKVEPLEGKENKVTFKCGIVTVVVLGSVIGVAEIEKEKVKSLLKSLEKAKSFILSFKTSGTAGEQQIKTCDFPEVSCKEKTFELKSTFGLGEELAAEVVESSLVFEKEVEFHF